MLAQVAQGSAPQRSKPRPWYRGHSPPSVPGVEGAAADAEAIRDVAGAVLPLRQQARGGALRHRQEPVVKRCVDRRRRRRGGGAPSSHKEARGAILTPGRAARPAEPEGARPRAQQGAPPRAPCWNRRDGRRR